jgi:large subunit ribosomal protein L1
MARKSLSYCLKEGMKVKMHKAHGKKYLEAQKLVDTAKLYQTQEAISLLKKISYTKFDPTVEVHMKLGVDPRHADQMVRGVAMLPAGTGKTVKVLVFAQGEKVAEAESAGADYVGLDDLIKRIEGDWLDFDVAIATPDIMGKVGRLGKKLGPRGLMPSPKAGTITFDVARTIREVKAGRVEFKVDKTALLHVPAGKLSFSDEALLSNITSVVDAVSRARPSGAKGTYIKSIVLSSTMSPSVRLDVATTVALKPQA